MTINLCPGCNELPITIRSFGRYKLVCANYISRNTDKATNNCIKHQTTPYSQTQSDSLRVWNNDCREQQSKPQDNQ